MVSLADVLKRDSEPLPGWLCSESPSFSRNDFFGFRNLYYPGSGNDGQPVSLCARAHAVHAFVYVDFAVDRETISGRVHNFNEGFRGYEVVCEEEVTEDTLRPGGWTRHVNPADLPDNPYWFSHAKPFKPFALFVVLQRNNDERYDETHGPERFAVLFIGGDGIATFDALYCQDDGTAAPFLVVIQDCGFDGNYDKFGQGGFLESIAKRYNQRPRWLLVGQGTEPWKDYNDVGADPEPGGLHQTTRRLYTLDTS